MPSIRKFFLENDAVIGIKSPSDYLFMKILRYTLTVVSSWPYKEIGRKESLCLHTFLKYIYLLLNFLCFVGFFSYIASNNETITFLEMGHIIATILLTIVDTLSKKSSRQFLKFSQFCNVNTISPISIYFFTKIDLSMRCRGINSPSDYLYMKILRYTLTVVSSWPYKEIGLNESLRLHIFLKYFYLFTTFLCFAGSFSYIKNNRETITFLEMGHIIVTILLNTVDTSRIVLLTFSAKYREVAAYYLTEFHLFFYKDRSDFAMQTHKKIHMVSHIFSIYLTALTLCGCNFFNLIPVYNNYSSGKYKPNGLQNSTFEHSLSFSYPFDTYSNVPGYIVACFLHWAVSWLCSIWHCMFDLLLSVMIFNLWGHFKILIHNIKDFPKPAHKYITLEDGSKLNVDIYSKDELLQVSDKLKECIDYHRDIVRFTDRMSNVFGPMLFVYYMYHQTAGCLLLLECSQMTAKALIRYLPLTTIVFQQLIQLSIIFELVGSESEKLKDAVYGLPWECMDTKNRKVVAFFLMNVQKPMHVKALGLADVGVTTMAAILKTAMSYFTFLRSV